MKLNCYVINLDRSPDRLEAIEADAAACGLSLIRVPAVDGKTVPPAERTLLDEPGFRRIHGKRPMDGEFGCYQSHLHAYERFLASDADIALILEDDAALKPGLAEAIEEIASVDDWDVVKLCHHRLPALRTTRRLGGGRRMGVAPFGPTGSSAAYLVNRAGARALVTRLVPMRLPFDVALDRGWHAGVRLRHVRPDLVEINALTGQSLIGRTKAYAGARLPAWRRGSTLLFRTGDAARRLLYALAAKGTR